MENSSNFKKSIFGELIVFVIVLAFVLPPQVLFANDLETDVLSWRLYGDIPQDIMVYAAQYTKEGQCIDVKTLALDRKGSIEFNSVNDCEYSLFFVNENLSSAMPAIDMTKNDSNKYFIDLHNPSENIAELNTNFINCVKNGYITAFTSPRNNYSNESTLDQLVYNEDGSIKISTVYYSLEEFAKLTDHLARTLKLAYEYCNTEDSELKEQISKVIPGLLLYWTENDFESTNWWYNDISTPNLLEEIALLARDVISPAIMEEIEPFMAKGSFTENTSLLNETGANAAWIAFSTLKYGILTENKEAIELALEKIKSQITISDGEGIRADGSFMQHGIRFYNGAYGKNFIDNIVPILYVIDGTSYEFDQNELDPLYTLIFDGMKYISIGNQVEPQSIGRDICNPGSTSLSGFAESLRKLTALDVIGNKEEIENYCLSIENNTRQSLGLKYFDSAKLIVINNPDFYFSFRSCDEDLFYGETLNDENILGYNSSYGTTTSIIGDKVDIAELPPVMDYALIPGTTAIYENDEQLLAHGDWNKRKLSGIFGGECFDDYAVSFAQTSHEGINFTVACFATNSSAVILGAGLSNSDDTNMITTLQQEIAQGSFSQNENIVIHNGVKYTKYEGGTLTADIINRTGSWRRNDVNGVTDPVSKDIFTLTMENEGSYAYSVMSEQTNEEYELIENSEEFQAVKMPNGIVCVICYKDGDFEYNNNTYTMSAGDILEISAKLN